MTNFHALELSLEVIRILRSGLVRICSRDPDLGRQLRRALVSVSLNLSEGRRRAGRDRRHHFRIAAGSADEALTSLRVAEALGYLPLSSVAKPLALLDRLLAMLWRLSR